MSFADKISSLMARPGQDVVPKDDVPWWMRYGGRAVGTIGGFIAIFLGVFNCTSIITADLGCLISGIWQILAGFIAICTEAPCCCMFVDYVQNLSDWVEKRPYWNRAVAYVVLAIPAIVLCPTLSSIFGSGLIFLTGVIYGMMALGKKASVEEMRSTAAAAEVTPTSNTKPNTMRSNLVENAQPISFTGAPIYDSNV
ncbi:hypothetical protein ILUMI_12291 [Ignelater luminosus]|uniref:Calcium channel flower n=1 Tax=Ignelater luminosus TaxID=2038154 RepID=A0A8K0CUI5_IGNLU|nr:hypothetical protein ILUMI_12291 [Ignelater luminosus]